MIIKNKPFPAADGWSAPARLLFNHFDAWAATCCIALVALLLHDAVTLQTAVLAAAVTVGYWLAFTLNDYYDAPQDGLDAKKARRNFFVRHQPAKWQMQLVVGGLTAVFILIFAQFGWHSLLLLLLCYVIMWSYSAPPLRLKSRPGLDLIVHACFVESFPYLLMLLLTQARWTQLDWVILAITGINSLNAQIEQQTHDFGLPAGQEKNFALRLGRPVTQRLLKGITAVLFIFILIFIFNGTIPAFLFPYGLLALPAVTHRFWRAAEDGRHETLIIGGIALALLYTIGLTLYFLIS